MADIAAQLAAVADKADQKAKLEDYKQLLQRLLAAPSVDALNAFVDHSAAPGGAGAWVRVAGGGGRGGAWARRPGRGPRAPARARACSSAARLRALQQRRPRGAALPANEAHSTVQGGALTGSPHALPFPCRPPQCSRTMCSWSSAAKCCRCARSPAVRGAARAAPRPAGVRAAACTAPLCSSRSRDPSACPGSARPPLL
jgi:hypothetical protein